MTKFGILEYALWICLLSVISITVSAQDFLNLDFEFSTAKAQPRKWSVEGEGDRYFVWVDSTLAQSGTHSLHVTQTNSEIYIFLRIPGRDVAGKKIRVESYVKLSGHDSVHARLMITEPGNHTPVSSQIAKTNQVDWQMISSEASYPPNYASDRLLVSINGSGTGEFWIDHVSILIEGKAYGNGVPDFREPTKGEIQALNENAIEIKSAEFKLARKDFAGFNHLIGNARIVALGENSHGSSSIYKLKLGLVKYLVQNLGFTIFALEMPVADAEVINQYVLFGKGVREDIIKHLVYKAWQTNEMINIVEWIKAYNKGKIEKIRFCGFDIQNGAFALKIVEDYAKKSDIGLYKAILEINRLNQHAKSGHPDWETIYKEATEMYTVFVSSNQGKESTSLSTIEHYLNVYLQSLSQNYLTDSTISRDEYMALNVNWILKHWGKGSKMILSADNSHVSKVTGKMGDYLQKSFSNRYIAIGFTFNSGRYSAYGKQKYYEVYPSYPGTYEYLFSKCRYKSFSIDIRKVSSIPLMSQISGFRSIGSTPQETTQFADMNLRQHFDAIIYTEKSIHTTYLK